MSEKAQHTPTPWELPDMTDKNLPVTIWAVKDERKYVVCETHHTNAAFIVKAVNCHEELVKALHCSLAAIEAANKENSGFSLKLWAETEIEGYKSILAKAKLEKIQERGELT